MRKLVSMAAGVILIVSFGCASDRPGRTTGRKMVEHHRAPVEVALDYMWDGCSHLERSRLMPDPLDRRAELAAAAADFVAAHRILLELLEKEQDEARRVPIRRLLSCVEAHEACAVVNLPPEKE